MSVIKSPFGEYFLYTVTNAAGASVSLTTLGAAVQSIVMPDRNGDLSDVVLGYDTPEEYLEDTEYLGAAVGRYANRIGGAKFSLNGVGYHICANEGKNSLHGGNGIHHRRFDAETGESSVTFGLTDPDGENGFPGELRISVRYTLTDDNSLIIDYTAQSDRDTVLSLTNHSYFNLAGSGSVLGHELKVNADRYLEVDAELIPTGRLADVKGTEFDLRERREIKNGFYDHCFVLNDGESCAELYDAGSGRKMTVTTDLPGIQVYAGGAMKSRTGKNGSVICKNCAVCLETEQFPDAPNKPHFPSAVLKAGELYRSRTVYKFTTE